VLGDRRFALVTGTPPYFPPGTGIESTRPQCAPCRFEHRGGVEDYVDAIARVLAPGGRAVICQGVVQAHRVVPAVERAGLVVEARLDVIPRQGKPALVAIFTLAWPADAAPRPPSALTVREADARWTAAFRAVRADLGMPAGTLDHEPGGEGT